MRQSSPFCAKGAGAAGGETGALPPAPLYVPALLRPTPLQPTPDNAGPEGDRQERRSPLLPNPPPVSGSGDGAAAWSEPRGHWVQVPAEPPRRGADDEGGDRLVALLEFLHRRRWTVALATLLAVAAAAAYAYARTPTYAAQSLVMVRLGTSATPAAPVPSETDDAFGTNERPLGAELFLIQTSTSIRERVAERLASADPSASAEGGLSGVDVTFGVVDPIANAISVNAVSEDPERAAIVANAYAEEYVALTREATRDRLSGWLDELGGREAERRVELERLETEQRALGSASGADAAASPAGGFLTSQIASLEMQREQARRDLQMRRATLESTLSDLDRLEPQLADQISSGNPERLAALRGQLAALRAEREQIERRYPDRASRDPRVAAELDRVDAEIQARADEASRLAQRVVEEGQLGTGTVGAANLAFASELRRTAQAQRAAIGVIDDQIDRLDALLARRYAELDRVPGQSAALARQQVEQRQLEQDRLYAEEAYEAELRRLEEIQERAERGGAYARVVQAASVPRTPAGLNSGYIVVLGLFVGLSLGLGVAAVRERVDGRFYKPEQLVGLGYPVLTTVPDMEPLLQEHARRNADGAQPPAGLATLLHPLSPMAETYRHLRTAVRRPGGGRVPQVVLVTSPGAGDGKSTTATNLAVALAESGLQTVLVDADLRRPSLHKSFGVPRAPGLFERLVQGAARDGDGAVPVGVDNLHLVPAGGAGPTGGGPDGAVGAGPAAALGSPVVASYLEELRGRYDAVVVDTPPVLATADAGRLAEESDAVLVMVRAGQTRAGELAHALEALELVGAPVAGLVFNGFDASQTYSYKHKYRSYTRSGLYPDYREEGPSLGRGRTRRRPTGTNA